MTTTPIPHYALLSDRQRGAGGPGRSIGFLSADDPCVLSTINAIEERLTDDCGLVYRYRSRDRLDS
jgi:hypothetical protein